MVETKPEEINFTDFEKEESLKQLLLLHFLGDNKLTEVYVVGKASEIRKGKTVKKQNRQ